MKSFSEQVRDAIAANGNSHYALAEDAGIPESALSRFMAGKQSMSLTTLDKIADVLGLQIVVGVSAAKKSRRPGRPKKENQKMQVLKRLTKSEWGWLAANAAKEAHEENFSSRRGVYVVEGAGVVYYDNNPFKRLGDEDPREELISQFRAFLKRSNLKEKASAYWPASGGDKHYTFAMAIQADEIMLESIRLGINSIVTTFMKGIRKDD